MILTGRQILEEVQAGRIVVDPFDPKRIEPNSYGFHLGDSLLVYRSDDLDPFAAKDVYRLKIPESGLVLEPERFYLGKTLEKMGSPCYAAHLYARFSTSSCGMFIQTSAPLGHTGAIIPWTLEIVVTQKIRIYSHILIGKICFWETFGEISPYNGKYRLSNTVVKSLLSREDS